MVVSDWCITILAHGWLGSAEETVSSSNNANNALDQNPPTMSKDCDTPITSNHGGINSSTQ